MFLKLITAMLAGALLWQMYELWKLGKELSTARDAYTLSRHRSTVACIGCITLVLVIIIEAMVRMSPIPYPANPALLYFHFGLVLLLVATFLSIVLRFTGIKSPGFHSKLAYAFYAVYALVIATGSVLLYQLPSPT